MKFFRHNKIIKNILALEDQVKDLSMLELYVKYQRLQYKSIDDLKVIQTSFAITREMAWRLLGVKHFPTQILGGLFLHQGNIIEMKTGEGKTLTATLPVALNALGGKGVHVVTVNEYLAKRDALWMGKLYNALGLTVGLIEENLSFELRRANYLADLTYVTNSELGFDFLRDNCALDLDNLVLRPLNYCIIDEVDSVLIDEARTPLIISDPKYSRKNKYYFADFLASSLFLNKDFFIDRKFNQVRLTDFGSTKIEYILRGKGLYNLKDPWSPYIINALKANYFFQKNKDYVILDNQVCIVDEFTGRITPDRRWGGGLHQAIEAKEGLQIQSESKTIASITYQHFFVRYSKVSGMTGTAKTSAAEFKHIYGLHVKVVPPAKPLKREDLTDLVFKTELGKWKAVAKECVLTYQKGRPILVGTTSIKNSEIMSEILTELKIPHQLLNARPQNIKREAAIVAQAGQKYAITIATNMAGRGTDIILGGNLNFLISTEILKCLLFKNFSSLKDLHLKSLFQVCDSFLSHFKDFQDEIFQEILQLPDTYLANFSEVLLPIYRVMYKIIQPLWLIESQEVKKLGGLYVLGTERHESSRIDNQLRGRAGRQGDPGSSQFFLSLEDELLRNFGGDRIKSLMNTFSLDDTQPLESLFLTRSVNRAQRKVESFYFESRKRLFDYDEVLNSHRDFVFRERNIILKSEAIGEIYVQYTENLLYSLFFHSMNEEFANDVITFESCLGCEFIDEDFISKKDFSWFIEQLWISQDCAMLICETYGIWIQEIQRQYLLHFIDQAWVRHLENMDILRDSIGWKAYEQRDPLLIYRDKSEFLFREMVFQICYNIGKTNLLIPLNL